MRYVALGAYNIAMYRKDHIAQLPACGKSRIYCLGILRDIWLGGRDLWYYIPSQRVYILSGLTCVDCFTNPDITYEYM